MKKHNEIAQGSNEWHHIRKGKITGTTLKGIMGTPKARQEAFYEILAERITKGIDDEYENAMDRGSRLEPDALAMFELETGKQVERTGFCEDDTEPMISNSPDGLIGDDEAVEIKCPGGKNYVKIWLLNDVPDEYEWQVVQYFVLNKKLQKVWFVAYNPDIPMHPMHIIEVKREMIEEKITEARKAQEVFIGEVNEALSKLIEI